MRFFFELVGSHGRGIKGKDVRRREMTDRAVEVAEVATTQKHEVLAEADACAATIEHFDAALSAEDLADFHRACVHG